MGDDADYLRELPTAIEQCWSAWRDLHRTPPDRLYHYTDADGLVGIVNSQTFWATHWHYVNDVLEGRYASGVILDTFDSRIGQSPPEVAKRLISLRDTYRANAGIQAALAQVHIVCFCQDPNLLSQWRAYGADGDGFALGFSPDALLRAVDSELATAMKLFKVIYDAADQRALVENSIDALLAAMNDHPAQDVFDRVPRLFAEMAFCFKHSAFAEEEEWRLVLFAHPNFADLFHVRTRHGRLVPYAEIPFRTKSPPYIDLVHGPTLDVANTRRALELLLAKKHPSSWNEVGISRFEAPLRPR